MSSNATADTPATVSKEETKPSSSTIKKEPEGFLGTGLDFNNPLHFGAALLVIAPVGYIGFNFLKNYLTKQFPQLFPFLLPQQQPPVVNTTQQPLQQQQPSPQRKHIDNKRKKTAEEEYYENLRLGRIVENNNNHLRNYNIHRDYSTPPSFTAASMLAAEEIVDIVDDNQITEYKKPIRQELIIPEEQETEFQRRYSKPAPKKEQQQRQPLEDSLLIPSDEIDIYSSDEINPDEIPKEFVNVGNVPKAFENIQMVEEEGSNNENENENEDDIYDIENMELDSETLKKMELNALKSNDDYYK